MLDFSNLNEWLLASGRNHGIIGTFVKEKGVRALVVVFEPLSVSGFEDELNVRAHCILRKQKGALMFDVYFEVNHFELLLRDKVTTLKLVRFSANIPKFPKLFRFEPEKLDFAIQQTALRLYQLINEIKVCPASRELRLEHHLLGVPVKDWNAKVVVDGSSEQRGTKILRKIVEEMEF